MNINLKSHFYTQREVKAMSTTKHNSKTKRTGIVAVLPSALADTSRMLGLLESLNEENGRKLLGMQADVDEIEARLEVASPSVRLINSDMIFSPNIRDLKHDVLRWTVSMLWVALQFCSSI